MTASGCQMQALFGDSAVSAPDVASRAWAVAVVAGKACRITRQFGDILGLTTGQRCYSVTIVQLSSVSRDESLVLSI